MARDFHIAGEAMVSVKQGSPAGAIATLSQLGLAVGGIRISPTFHHLDIHTDDWGGGVPAEVMWMLCDVHIDMTLIHYDRTLLETCVQESMGGAISDGTLIGAGKPMGGLQSAGLASNHYIRLNLASPVDGRPWRFLSAYLAHRPLEMPLGTKASEVRLNWRAIPYQALNTAEGLPTSTYANGNELKSAGVVIWDHTLDT